jgi:hypothetical protein
VHLRVRQPGQPDGERQGTVLLDRGEQCICPTRGPPRVYRPASAAQTARVPTFLSAGYRDGGAPILMLTVSER